MPNKKALKIVQINTVPNGSTGSIMMSIHKQLLKDGYDSYVVWGRGRKAQNDREIYMNDKLGVYFHVLYSRLTGKTGFASKRATKKLLKKLDKIKPDIIHLHNLHGYYINIELLFNYIKKNNIKTIWTLHDCWAFTGHCVYFEISKCDCWKGEKCIDIKSYPKSLKNSSQWCYAKKKQLLTGVENLTIVTPSDWLMGLVKKSYLKDYPSKVINNGINTDIFKKIDPAKLTFREKYNLKDKIIILGVASPWTERKGLNDFIKLSKILNEKQYKIVLVGLTKKQVRNLPKSILGLPKTNNITELVELYNSADIFFNPTYEDNYPSVNIEATACGVTIVTYNTGGAAEIIKNNSGKIGFICDDINSFQKIIDSTKRIEKVASSKICEKKMKEEYRLIYER